MRSSSPAVHKNILNIPIRSWLSLKEIPSELINSKENGDKQSVTTISICGLPPRLPFDAFPGTRGTYLTPSGCKIRGRIFHHAGRDCWIFHSGQCSDVWLPLSDFSKYEPLSVSQLRNEISLENCPQSHRLRQREIDSKRCCDVCGNPNETGITLRGCSECDWDVCSTCTSCLSTAACGSVGNKVKQNTDLTQARQNFRSRSPRR